ncbi:fasciclin domain-containing protein [Sphingobacterium bovistauri]|uniref:Fasciclin domain-containing protein n=1 Tax=Sphingobacterium bovistauri TaxID=2781959 RepID=A0ABS7Z8M8_9SPHI|nr:fasciclin domain-containing protein [Sphingobacterium bovistauri]MCA5005912.1 fasciclin domain-containing protein [Sphingobacterium bovistauri]
MKNKFFCSILVALFLLNFFACEKSQYIDSGVFQNDFKGTTMDYLKSRPELFDSLTKIIDQADLANEINMESNTFFAPPNISIMKSVRHLNYQLKNNGQDTIKNLDKIDKAIWREFLQMYIFRGSRMLNDYPQVDTNRMTAFPGQGFVSIGNNNMNIGVIYNDVKTKNNEGQEQVVQYAGYRQLYFSSVDVTNELGRMINVPVATSNLKTSNGVIHVLNFSKHSLGFSGQYFASRAYTFF